jgi:hypothetical protein
MKNLYRITNPYSKTVWMTYPHRRCKFTAAVQIRNDWQKNIFMKKILILFSFIAISFTQHHCSAQQEKNIWYFGRQAGLDFSGSNPIPLSNSALKTDEAAAVMNNSSGNVLFYTNGVAVWNALNDTMENGGGLFGNYSTTQTLIVPKPGVEDSLYYIFTAGCVEYNFYKGLRYSVVDLKYNNGLGKVTSKNNLLYYPASEKITAITHANGYDFWVLAHESGNNNFLEYLITCYGFDTIPTIISIGQPFTNPRNNMGAIKASSTGQKLAIAARMICELYDLNTFNGDITNCIQFPNDSTGGGSRYGIAFSPDNSKLYLDRSAYPGTSLWQFNLLAGTPIDIINSQCQIFFDTISNTQMLLNLGTMALANDGKIYLAHYTAGNGLGDTLLGVINYPDSLGLACSYNHYGFNLNGKNSVLSLPNFIETPYNYISCIETINESDENLKDIVIFPNPANEYITIENPATTKNATLSVFNLQGQLIFSQAIKEEKTSVNISTLARGMYIIKVYSEKGVAIKKFIKE